MVHVLNVIHAPRWGGLHAMSERVGALCTQAGHPWTVVLPLVPGDNGADRLNRAGLDVISIPLRRIRKSPNPFVQLKFLTTIPIDVLRIYRILKSGRYDVVQICGLLHFHAALAARLAGIPVVWQLHSDQPPRFLRKSFVPIVRRLADAVMTSGKGMIASHPGLSSATRNLKIIPFYAPVNIDRFRPDPSLRADGRALMQVGHDRIVVGTVGGRGPNKNHGMLVRVAALLRNRAPDLVFRICGGWQLDHREWYQKEVIDLAKRLGLIEAGIVEFHEPGEHVPTFMNGMDIFALPSRGEGASLVTAEAMACRLPVVANDVGSLSDSVVDGTTGFLNRSGSDEEMADHIYRLYADTSLRTTLGAHSRETALRMFSEDAAMKAHLAAYDVAAHHFAARRR